VVGCATENIPAATLLVPYFQVSRNGTQGEDIPEGGADTLVSFTNTTSTGLIVHVTVWNKYGKPILGFNVPTAAFDVTFFRMKDILNGKLRVNPYTQTPARLPLDPCGQNRTTGVYDPRVGFGATVYSRFPNPSPGDAARSISIYDVPAFPSAQRRMIWDSLDESGGVVDFRGPGGVNILDEDNPLCGSGSDGRLTGDFSGYVTLDVVNYCTNFFPDESSYYTRDAIATRGWEEKGFTPNALIGDVVYVDRQAGTSFSGSMVSLIFDSRLEWPERQTFYGRNAWLETRTGEEAPFAYRFAGDGRLPLGTRYGLRYLSDTANRLQSSMVVWRTDRYRAAEGFQTNLCDWWSACAGVTAGGCAGLGSYTADRAPIIFTFDNDSGLFIPTGGCGLPFDRTPYTFLESQRIDLLNNGEINPGYFKGGWIDIRLPGTPGVGQAFVGVMHQGPGVSVGMAAARFDAPYRCSPVIVGSGVPSN